MDQIASQRRARLLQGSMSKATVDAKRDSALNITDVALFAVCEPVSKTRYSLLRLKAQSGLVGWGECRYDPNADRETLQSDWIGKPANAYSTIPPSDPFRAALDMACLDIIGHAANAPVYRILGGPTRSKIRAYSWPHSEGSAVSVIEAPRPAWRNQGQSYENQIAAAVDAVPPDKDFIVVANGSLTPGDAASVARTLEHKHPLWFDEPCSHSNIEALRKVADETVVPLGFGAGIDDPGVFQALLREGIIDVLRPDITLFGISRARRIAALAETYYVAVAPRHTGGPLATAAAIHLATSLPNFFIQHVPIPTAEEDRAMRRELVSPSPEVLKAGFLEVTTAPGLGVTVSEGALEKYRAS
jgi:galactonate dehydratase